MLLAFAYLIGTNVLVLSAYGGARFLHRRYADDELKDLSLSLIFRISALHSLILALVFAQEMITYRSVSLAERDEATAVASLYYDIGRYGADDATTETVRTDLTAYIADAVCTEWSSLSDGQGLVLDAWMDRERLLGTILDLEPSTTRQRYVLDGMLRDLEIIEQSRNARGAVSSVGVTAIFWIPAILGLAIVSILYSAYSAKPIHIILLSFYATFNGIVLLMIHAFGNPYAAPGQVTPSHFEALVAKDTALSASPDLACIRR
ncbi:MAG: hypothetical protein AAF830_07510 [Pseudomonadota bacterium]